MLGRVLLRTTKSKIPLKILAKPKYGQRMPNFTGLRPKSLSTWTTVPLNNTGWVGMTAAVALGATGAWFYTQQQAEASQEQTFTEMEWKRLFDQAAELESGDNSAQVIAVLQKLMKRLAQATPEALVADFDRIHRIFTTMSVYLTELEIYRAALMAQETFLDVCNRAGIMDSKPEIYSYALNDLGNTYYELKELDKAKENYERTVVYVERLKRENIVTSGSLMELQIAYGKLALVNLKQNPIETRNVTNAPFSPTITKLLTLQTKCIENIAGLTSEKSTRSISVISCINTLLELGNMLRSLGENDKALQCLKQAATLCDKYKHFDINTNNGQPSISGTFDNIKQSTAAFLARTGDLKEAESITRQLLASQIKKYGPDSDQLIPTYNNLGSILISQQNYKESVEALKKAIALIHNQNSNVMEWTQKLYHLEAMLGTAYKEQDLLPDALIAYEHSLISAVRYFGDKSPETAEVYNLLGNLYRRGFHNIPDAIEHLQGAYNRALASMSPKKGLFLKIANDYASLLSDSKVGKYTEADKVLTNLLDNQVRGFGEHSPQTAAVLHSLGLLKTKVGANDDAEKYFKDAIAVYTSPTMSSKSKSPGPGSYALAGYHLSIAKFYMERQKFREARGHLDASMSIFKKLDQAGYPKSGLAQVQAVMGKWQALDGNDRAAMVSMEEALAIETQLGSLDDPTVVELQLELSKMLLKNNLASRALARLEIAARVVLQSRHLSVDQKKAFISEIEPLIRQVKSK